MEGEPVTVRFSFRESGILNGALEDKVNLARRVVRQL